MNVLMEMVGVITYATIHLEALSADVTLDSLWPQMGKHAMVRATLTLLHVGYLTPIMCNTVEPPSVPGNVRVSNVGQRTATVSWDPPINTFLNSLTAVSAYRVSASQGQFQQGNHTVTRGQHSRSHDFMDLEEYTEYSFTVEASNTFGYGAASEPEEATTLEAGLCLGYVMLSATSQYSQFMHELVQCVLCPSC